MQLKGQKVLKVVNGSFDMGASELLLYEKVKLRAIEHTVPRLLKLKLEKLETLFEVSVNDVLVRIVDLKAKHLKTCGVPKILHRFGRFDLSPPSQELIRTATGGR